MSMMLELGSFRGQINIDAVQDKECRTDRFASSLCNREAGIRTLLSSF
jgi:hypothetical protein